MQHWGERGPEASRIELTVIGLVGGALALLTFSGMLLYLFS